MIKNITFLFLLLLSGAVNAQVKETVKTSVKYKVNYLNDGKSLVDDVCQLDISEHQSYFYSQGKLDLAIAMNNKVQKARQRGEQPHFEADDYRDNLFEFNTIKSFAGKKVITCERVGVQYFGYVRDSIGGMRWKILPDTKWINKLRCRKAEMITNGKKTTAWFCPDIPIQDGPFYLCNLPGLIVSSYSENGWKAELIAITYPKDKKPLWIWPYKLVSKAQFNKIKKTEEAKQAQGILPSGDKLERVQH